MPRARLTPRLAARADQQLVFAARQEAKGAVAKVEAEVEAVSAEIPPNLASTIADVESRLSTLEQSSN